MLFNVATLLREPVGSTRQYKLAPAMPIHGGEVDLTRTPDGALVHAKVAMVVDAACSRCLAPFGYPITVEFSEVFQQQVDPITGARVEPMGDDDEAFTIGLDHVIDITEAVRQYSVMAAAMQPLCRPDCPGICAQCGRDLNLGPCSCDPAPADPRWSALEALRTSSHGQR